MNYTENLSLGLPEYGEDADVADLNRNSGILDAYCYNTRQIECKPYDSTKTYMSGDLSIHNEVVYECNTDNTTGTWDDSKWDSTTLAEQIAKAKQSGGESALADLEDVEITNPSTGQALLFDDDDDKWKNQDLPDVSVTKTATGNPIEFTDAASAPLVKCTTAITGSQDLHGYDKPWVGGAGKNKFDAIGNTSTKVENGVNITLNSDGTVLINGTTTSVSQIYWTIPIDTARTYAGMVLNGNIQQSGVALGLELASTPYTNFASDTGSGSTISEEIANVATFVNLILRISANVTLNNALIKPMIRLATVSDSTFEPYSNICPITAYNQSTISVEDENEVVQQTSTATFSNSIYQGNADFVGGSESHDMQMLDWTGLSWTIVQAIPMIYAKITGAKTYGSSEKAGAICSHYETITRQQIGYAAPYRSGIAFDGDYLCISDPSKSWASVSDALADLTSCQIAYELATPTTETITPTNLPIKSLFGYNHIESSTGDMEIEYITENYQPLVDLIQSSNGHTYSTQEQVVGKWIDGKTLYEMTVHATGITYPTNSSVSVHDFTDKFVVQFTAQVVQTDGSKIPLSYFSATNEHCHIWATNTQFRVNQAGYSITDLFITYRYTKPSESVQTRSLSATVTSQKAQIEPLTDKTEEVPTEEEKVVNNEEENNDETR